VKTYLNEWNFGQILPILVLLAPVYSIMAYYLSQPLTFMLRRQVRAQSVATVRESPVLPLVLIFGEGITSLLLITPLPLLHIYPHTTRLLSPQHRL
jgi:hypothetical protein